MTIAAVPDSSFTSGSDRGLTTAGSTGIEVPDFYGTEGVFERFRKNPEQIPGHYYFNMGGNHFVFGVQLGTFANGFVTVLREIGLDRGHPTESDLKLRHSIERFEEAFAKSYATFAQAFGPFGAKTPFILNDFDGQPFASADHNMLFASIFLKHRKDHGGDDWAKRFFRHLFDCPPSPSSPGDATFANGQLLNWVVAASLAAGTDLSPQFRDRWRFPLAPELWQALQAVDWKKSDLTVGNVFELLPIDHLPHSMALNVPTYLTPERRQQNLLVGGTFEDDAANQWMLSSWHDNNLSGAVEGGVVKEGQKAAAIHTTINDDAFFEQLVTVKPKTRYLLSGWIKTKEVIIAEGQKYGPAGATLSILGDGYEHSRSVVGTTDWRYVTLIFDSRDRSEIKVCARLGYDQSLAKGEAWFDDLSLIPIGETPASPQPSTPLVTGVEISPKFQLRNLKLLTATPSAGDELKFSYDVVNASNDVVQLPAGQKLIGARWHWIERLGNPQFLSVLSMKGGATKGRWYGISALGISELGSTIPADKTFSFALPLQTQEYPPGRYRFYVEFRDSARKVLQTEQVEFELKPRGENDTAPNPSKSE